MANLKWENTMGEQLLAPWASGLENMSSASLAISITFIVSKMPDQATQEITFQQQLMENSTLSSLLTPTPTLKLLLCKADSLLYNKHCPLL